MAGSNEQGVPQGKFSVVLSGLGFYKLSAKRRKTLTYVFLASLAIHVVALLLFGGYIIMRSKPEEVTMFKTPPPSRKYEPRKLEHKVTVQKRQRSSSRPSMMPRIVSMRASDLALPEIKVDPKLIRTTFQPKFKAVSGKGLGAGLGTGYGTHGFGEGVSSFNFFGIHGRGEKVAILVDVSVSMVEEERGGVTGYMRVKQRLGQVVDALSEGALFNVIVFADAASVMEKKLVIANNDNKKKAKMFLRPFNTKGNWGLISGNVQPRSSSVIAAGGSTRLDLALTAAYEQGSDTILIISDGAPMVEKAWTADQIGAQRVMQKRWAKENQARVQAWDNQFGGGQGAVTEKVWVPATPAVAARPARKGPPKEGKAPDRGSPGRPAQPGHWRVVTRHAGGWHRRPTAPQIQKPGYWTLSDFVEHLRVLHNEIYVKKGRKEPIIHCIGYQIDQDGHTFLKELARHYHGKYRRVKSLKS